MMANKPLHISMSKIEQAERGREAEAQMEAGGPSPMEETYRLTKRYDPTFELTIEQHRQNYEREKDHE